MERPSQKIHKVFINSSFRNKQVEKNNDFTFYCRPALTGVSKLKVRSVSVPMSSFTFSHLSAAQRTFTANATQAGYSTPATVVFSNERNYTRGEFVQALNNAFSQTSIDVNVTADAHDGSAIVFTNNMSGLVIITTFPAIQYGFTLPRGITPSGGTLRTSHLDFGSSISKVCYLAIPNLVNSSRCGLGRQSIVTSVLNPAGATYGTYATRIDDSGSEHILGKNEVDAIHIHILDENHDLAELGELPVFVELEIY